MYAQNYVFLKCYALMWIISCFINRFQSVTEVVSFIFKTNWRKLKIVEKYIEKLQNKYCFLQLVNPL